MRQESETCGVRELNDKVREVFCGMTHALGFTTETYIRQNGANSRETSLRSMWQFARIGKLSLNIANAANQLQMPRDF